jgi:uncharacterized membrane protein
MVSPEQNYERWGTRMHGRGHGRQWLGSLGRLMRGDLGHKVFWLGIFFKTVDGFLETAGAIALASISNKSIVHLVYAVFREELREDPHDLLANYLVVLSQHLSASEKTFAVLYLLIHGVTKLGIVSAIWWKKLWAYPLAGVVFSLFAVYQMVRFTYTHSAMMILLTAVDLVIIALLKPEYTRVSLELQQRKEHTGRTGDQP